MADRANSTSAPEIHPLSGSSSPSGGVPAFEPLASEPRPSKPRYRTHPPGPAPTSASDEVVTLAERLIACVKREDDVSRRLAMLQLSEIRAWECERLEGVSSRMVRRINRLMRKLAAMSALTRRAAVLKAEAYIELRASGWEMQHDLDRLALSLARDSVHLKIEIACAPDGAELDVELIEQAAALTALRGREREAWRVLGRDDPDEGPEVDACRRLSDGVRIAGKALALIPAHSALGVSARAAAMLSLTGSHKFDVEDLVEHRNLAMVVVRDAAGLVPATALANPTLSADDARLIALADEIEAVITEADRLTRGNPLDCDQIPGWPDLEERRYQILDALAQAPAQGMAGLAAKARVLQIRDIEGDVDLAPYLGSSLAEDVVRLHAADALPQHAKSQSMEEEKLASLEDYADIDFKAWPDEEDGWSPKEYGAYDNPFGLGVRVAWLILHKDKSELIEKWRDMPDKAAIALRDTIEASLDFFKEHARILEVASLRSLSVFSTLAVEQDKEAQSTTAKVA